MASAGIPFPLIYRAVSRNVEVVNLRGMPLGCFARFPYEEKEVLLDNGDTIVLMTDGLPELFNDQQQGFGYSRIREIVSAAGDKSPREIIEQLVKAGEAWAHGRPQDDDITLMVLKVKDNGQKDVV